MKPQTIKILREAAIRFLAIKKLTAPTVSSSSSSDAIQKNRLGFPETQAVFETHGKL